MATKKQTKERRLHVAILKQMVVLATGGFGLVAALAWNNVIQEFVDEFVKPYLPHGSGIISLVLYAIFVTILAVIVTVYLSKVLERFKD